ncbi:mannose-P-dolichol utilization defect 1 protein homolog [Oscarella lobularis]|uniref:mannose-P-dolichol utilization defect 1 protein homolog n=1 Tax=Oscarella lobularis TaxID=121494 RepID=UPI003313E691
MAASGFADVVSYAITPKCYEEYFLNYNFFDAFCFKAILSRYLNLSIVLGSVLVKLPQIVKIVKESSVDGLSLISFFLELTSVTFTVSYNIANQYAFSTWGESFFISIQCAILVAMFLYYTRRPFLSGGFLLAYVMISYVLSFGLVPIGVLTSLQITTIPIMMASKVFQIWKNFTNGSTGQLSAITTFLNLFGTLARIFTTLQDVGDYLILLSFVVSTFLNALLVFQLLYYWNVKKEGDKKD